VKLDSLDEHNSLGYEEPTKYILGPLPIKLPVRLQTSLVVMLPIASGFLKLVHWKVDLLIIMTLDKSELLLHGLQPMISCHRISSSIEDGWFGPHKTMIPTKQWRLGSMLIGLHVHHELGHPSHHLLSCLMMGFVSLKYIYP
jgi:hypothetical protein